jgi:hypothetical protein
MGLNHSLQSDLLHLQLLGGFFVMFPKCLQLGDPSADFLSMVTQPSDFLHGFIEISSQSTSQLHFVSQASLMIMTFGRKHHDISSFTGSTREVAVLGMLHLVILDITQCSQRFMCNISNSSLEHPPQGGSLNHLENTMDMTGHRLLLYDHPYVPEIGVPS